MERVVLIPLSILLAGVVHGKCQRAGPGQAWLRLWADVACGLRNGKVRKPGTREETEPAALSGNVRWKMKL